MNPQILQQIEKEVEHTLFQLIDLKIEDDYIGMNKLFAKLLATLQQHQLISPTLEVLIDPLNCLTETKTLLVSLQEMKQRHRSRHKLLTHRQILNVWLRKNTHYKREILPGFF